MPSLTASQSEQSKAATARNPCLSFAFTGYVSWLRVILFLEQNGSLHSSSSMPPDQLGKPSQCISGRASVLENPEWTKGDCLQGSDSHPRHLLAVRTASDSVVSAAAHMTRRTSLSNHSEWRCRNSVPHSCFARSVPGDFSCLESPFSAIREAGPP